MERAYIARVVALLIALLAHFGIDLPEGITEDIVTIIVSAIAIYTLGKSVYNKFKKKEDK